MIFKFIIGANWCRWTVRLHIFNWWVVYNKSFHLGRYDNIIIIMLPLYNWEKMREWLIWYLCLYAGSNVDHFGLLLFLLFIVLFGNVYQLKDSPFATFHQFWWGSFASDLFLYFYKPKPYQFDLAQPEYSIKYNKIQISPEHLRIIHLALGQHFIRKWKVDVIGNG